MKTFNFIKPIFVFYLFFYFHVSQADSVSGDGYVCKNSTGNYTFTSDNNDCVYIGWKVYENGSLKTTGWTNSGNTCSVLWSSNFSSGEVWARKKKDKVVYDENDSITAIYTCFDYDVWVKMEIDLVEGDPYFLPISAVFCTGDTKTISVSTPCPNKPLDWEVPSGWKINGGSNVLNNTPLRSISVKAPSSGNGTFNLKVRYNSDPNWVTKLVQLGPVQSSQVNLGKSYNMYDYTMCPSSSYAIIATGPPSTNFTNWSFNGGFSSTYGYGNQAAVTTSYNYTGAYISVTASNLCPSSVTVGRMFSLSYSCPYSMMTVDDVNIYPNPVENELTVEWPKEAEVTEIILFSEGKEKVVSIELNQKQKENKAIINLEGLKSETYYLHLTDGVHVVKKQVVKK